MRGWVLLTVVLSGCVAPSLTPAGDDAAAPADALMLTSPVELPNPPRGAFEPMVAVDGAGTVLVTGTRMFEAVPLWVSHDDGATFRMTRPTGLPAGTEGQVVFSPDGDAYMVDETIAGLTVARSQDRGDSWEVRSYATFAVPGGDRPWIAAGANGRFYATWNQIPSGQWVAASEDGGRTFLVHTPIVGENVVTGPLAVAPDGALLLARDEKEGPVLYVSRDGARSFERHLAWPAEGERGWFNPTPAVDEAGNYYVTTIERLERGTRARYAVSTDGGATFSAPRELTAEPGMHVHAWSAAGPRGRLAVAFYENPNGTTTPDEGKDEWFARLVVIDGADTATPAVRETRLVAHAVDEGTVCTRENKDCQTTCVHGLPCVVGISTSSAKWVGDYLGVAMEPDGTVHVVFQDLSQGDSIWHVRTV